MCVCAHVVSVAVGDWRRHKAVDCGVKMKREEDG